MSLIGRDGYGCAATSVLQATAASSTARDAINRSFMMDSKSLTGEA